MKNPYAVLQEKLAELERLKTEVAALATVIPLLDDEKTPPKEKETK